MNKHMREPAHGFVSSHANGKWGSQAIYVILNVGLTSVFQDLVKKFPLALWEREQLCEQSELTTAGEGLIRCEEAKRQRCKASIVKTYNPSPQWGEGATLPRNDKFSSRFTLHSSPRRKAAFTLAEMMVVMLILSIIMAAMAPVMTTRNKLDQSSPWVWATNGSDAYYGLGDAQVAMIGQQEAEETDTNSRLVINTGDGKEHILFKQGNAALGSLKFDNNGLLLGSLSGGDLVENSVAIGRNTSVAQDNSTAVGVNASASNSNATALGHSASASGTYSIAIGGEAPPTHAAQSSGSGSIAIGPGTVASQASSISIGSITESTGLHSIAIGTNNKVSGQDSISFGTSQNLSDDGAIGIGNSVQAGEKGIAIGSPSNAGVITSASQNGVSIGSSAVSSGVNGISIGNSSSNNGEDSISIGHNAVVTGIQAIAIGAESSTNSTVGGRATVVGYSARATSGSSAFGYNSTAESSSSVAIGETAHSEGGDAIAIGHSSHARNGWSIAIGSNAVAYESNTIAIGRDANASKDGNIAIGTNACQGVTGTNVTCLGANSGPASKYSHLSGDSNMVYIGDPNSTVFIPGNLVVRGTVLLNGERGRVVLRPGNAQGDWAVIRRGDYDGGDDNLRGYPTDVGEDKAWYDRYSDRRLKYVGKESTSGLEKIKQLKVFNYTFKKDEKKTPHVGVIAQDLQKVFPDAVTKAKDGFLRIRFEDMFYAMINAIKELDAKYQAQEKRIDELEARMEKLEAQIK